jgi:hypothetical protein
MWYMWQSSQAKRKSPRRGLVLYEAAGQPPVDAGLNLKFAPGFSSPSIISFTILSLLELALYISLSFSSKSFLVIVLLLLPFVMISIAAGAFVPPVILLMVVLFVVLPGVASDVAFVHPEAAVALAQSYIFL